MPIRAGPFDDYLRLRFAMATEMMGDALHFLIRMSFWLQPDILTQANLASVMQGELQIRTPTPMVGAQPRSSPMVI